MVRVVVTKPHPVKMVAKRHTVKAAPKKATSPLKRAKVTKQVKGTKTKLVQKAKATTVPKVTLKVIAKKRAAPAPALTKEEKEQQKLERERLREERNKIKEERAKIRAEKEALKQEKLRMWELVPTTSVPQIKTNPFLTKSTGKDLINPTSNSSIFCNNRSVLQAAIQRDSKKLKALLADYANISNPF